MASYAPLFVNSNDRRYPALFPSNCFLFVLAAQLSWLPTFLGTQGHVWDPPMAPFCNSGTLDLWLSTKFYNKYAYPSAKRQLEQQYDYLCSWHLKKLKKTFNVEGGIQMPLSSIPGSSMERRVIGFNIFSSNQVVQPFFLQH